MGIESVIASKENLKAITLEEKQGIDDYVSLVRKAVADMDRAVELMSAYSDTMTEIRGVLETDFSNINRNIRKLESLSEQLSQKAEGYQQYLDTIHKKRS